MDQNQNSVTELSEAATCSTSSVCLDDVELSSSLSKLFLRYTSTYSIESSSDLEELPSERQLGGDDSARDIQTATPEEQKSAAYILVGSRSIILTDDDASSRTSLVDRELFLKSLEDLYSRSELQSIGKKFFCADSDGDGYINIFEFTALLESMGTPHTHLEVKNLLSKYGGAGHQWCFQEFLHIYSKVRNTFKPTERNWLKEWASAKEVDVAEVGVRGAKLFFEAKIAQEAESAFMNGKHYRTYYSTPVISATKNALETASASKN